MNNPESFVDSSGLFPVDPRDRKFLEPYFPTLDFDNVDIEIGIPDWVMSILLQFGPKEAAGPDKGRFRPLAVTIGKTIYFIPTEYKRQSNGYCSVETMDTLAHELTHVMQFEAQGSNRPVMLGAYLLSSGRFEDSATAFGNSVSDDYARLLFEHGLLEPVK